MVRARVNIWRSLSVGSREINWWWEYDSIHAAFLLSMLTKNCILAALLTFLCSTAALLFAQPHPADVLSVVQTLQSLRDYEQDGRPESQRITFELPEAIVNLYLTTSLSVTPRPALKSLKVEILPGNRMIAVGDIDWERLLEGDESMVPAKLREQLMEGGPFKAAFTFRVESGFVTFTVNAVPSGGIQIPDAVLRGIVRRVAQSQPEKFDTTKPIPLPFGLRTFSTREKMLVGGTGLPRRPPSGNTSRQAPSAGR